MSAQQGVAEPRARDKGPLTAGPPRARIRLAFLDGLRAVAATYVILFHAVLGFSERNLIGVFRPLRRLFAFGHEAVAIFIVLSGYCLMLPIIRKNPSELSLELGPFVKRRAFRILPPYFATLLLSAGALVCLPVLKTPHTGTIWDETLPGLTPGPLLSHALLVHNWSPEWGYQINGPLWSVATEWQIYFFMPLLLLPLWRRLGAGWALLVAVLLGYAPLLFAAKQAQVAIPWYLFLFALGMAAAAVSVAPSGFGAAWRRAVPWRPVSVGLWLLCLLLSTAMPSLWFGLKPLVDALIGAATAALLVHLTACVDSGSRGRLLQFLEWPPLVKLGHFSYSVYLTHLPILALCYFGLRPLEAKPPLLVLGMLLLGTPASLLFAYGFHLGVERRFMRS
jgi:peptidoglycan/LPS O-acetylase OafA/YrhL